jgi:hypothetical protein
MKVKSMKVAHRSEFYMGKVTRRTHRVISIKNSMEYDPGQELSDEEMRDLCGSSQWDITRVPMNEGGES